MLHNANAIATSQKVAPAEPGPTSEGIDLAAVQKAVDRALQPFVERLDALEKRINASLDDSKGSKKRGGK